MAYEVLASEKAFSGKLFGVRRDRVLYPSGREGSVEVVEHPGAIALIPIDGDGRVLFVRQYRHPVMKHILEIPAGTLKAGEDPEACAHRECREETGMAPGSLHRLGAAYVAPGYSTEYVHFFLAQELHPSPLAPDQDEDLALVRLSWAEIDAKIDDGTLEDTKSIAGVALARHHLRGQTG
jgi:ADP-ribose pyrophosphatase